jgi:hypothetical protein
LRQESETFVRKTLKLAVGLGTVALCLDVTASPASAENPRGQSGYGHIRTVVRPGAVLPNSFFSGPTVSQRGWFCIFKPTLCR